MSRWQHVIDISAELLAGDPAATAASAAKQLMDAPRASRPPMSIINAFRRAETKRQLDAALECLYDWGDEGMRLYVNRWPVGKY